jgi:hypothetical protein
MCLRNADDCTTLGKFCRFFNVVTFSQCPYFKRELALKNHANSNLMETKEKLEKKLKTSPNEFLKE